MNAVRGLALSLLAGLLAVRASGQESAPWTGLWIWAEQDRAAVNEFRYFRARFQVGKVPKSVPLRITADSSYQLYLNGKPLGQGPEASFPADKSYDTWEVAPHLKSGTNTIAVMAYHRGIETVASPLGRPGLIAQLDWDEGGVRRSFGTTEAWRTAPADAWLRDTARLNPGAGFLEVCDLAKAPAGWVAEGFDDSGWQAADAVGSPPQAPWNRLVPRVLPVLTETVVAPVKVVSRGTVPRHGLLLDVPSRDGEAVNRVKAAFTIDRRFSWAMEALDSGSIRCQLDRKEVVPTSTVTGAGWGLEVPAGEHFMYFYLSGDKPAARLTLHLNGKPPLEAMSWFVNDNAVEPVPVAGNDPSRLVAAEVAGFVPDKEAFREGPAGSFTVESAGAGRVPVVVLDFGRVVNGAPEIEADLPRGTVLDLVHGEYLEGGMVRPASETCRYTDRYAMPGGPMRFRVKSARAFRYLMLAVRGLSGRGTIRRVRAVEEALPATAVGQFTCDDAELNAVWEACRTTLRACMTDRLEATPARGAPMRLPDLGAAARACRAVYGPDLPLRSLKLFAEGMNDNGLMNLVSPSGLDARYEDCGLFWVMAARDHWRETGDEAFLKWVYPVARQAMSWYAGRRDEYGLMRYRPARLWLDREGRDGTAMDRGGDGPLGAYVALYAGALDAAAELAESAGDAVSATGWRDNSAETKASLNAELWDGGRGVYADTHTGNKYSPVASQQTNVLCAALGAGTPIRLASALEYTMGPSRPDVARMSGPGFAAWWIEALVAQGRKAEALFFIRERWMEMMIPGKPGPNRLARLKRLGGNATFGEAWEPRGEDSWCASAAASPLYYLPRILLGATPLKPGYATARVEPFYGGCEKARGKVPTPRGPLAVSWRHTAKGLIVEVTPPAGATATVVAPKTGANALMVDGVKAWDRATVPPATVKVEGGSFVVEAPGGKTTTLMVKGITRRTI